MSYYYNGEDPVLMKLESGTLTPLNRADIRCLEDLFLMEEEELYDLHGVGQKRGDEILDLLYALPFDYRSDDLPGNPAQDPYLGVHPSLESGLTGYSYRYEKYFKRGVDYYREDRVGTIHQVDDAPPVYEITVIGSRAYTVTLALQEGQAMETHCTCPAYSKWQYGGGGCKHIIAAAFELARRQRMERFESGEPVDRSYRRLAHSIQRARERSSVSYSYPLEYILVNSSGEWNLYPTAIYPRAAASGSGSQSYPNSFYRWQSVWNDLEPGQARDRLIVSYLRKHYEPDPYAPSSSDSSHALGDVLDLLGDRTLFLERPGEPNARIHIQGEPLELTVDIDREDDPGRSSLSLTFQLTEEGDPLPPEEVEIVTTNPCWVLHGTTLARLEATDLAREIYLNAGNDPVSLPLERIDNFLQEFYPVLDEAGIPLRMSPDLAIPEDIDPVPRLYLQEYGNSLRVELSVCYGDAEVNHPTARENILLPNPAYSENSPDVPPLVSAPRQPGREKAWEEQLRASGLTPAVGYRTYTAAESPIEWVTKALPELSRSGFEVYGRENLRRFAPPRKMTASTVRVSSGEQWFELEGELAFEGLTVDLRDIRRVLVPGKPHVRLDDGTTGELPETWVSHLKTLLHLAEQEEEGENSHRLPKMAAPAIHELGEEADHFTADNAFRDHAELLRSFTRIEEAEQPELFQGDLRPYQLGGLSWMRFLRRFGFGGILADDMGLGKTVQVLALLESVRERQDRFPKALVVAPLSVIPNWEVEARRFLPNATVHIHHGTGRADSADALPEADLFVTTYGTMRNDIDLLARTHFDYLILDESHNIRNPSTKTSQAARKLKGDHRLCLTGTPVQNTAMDLWPQFEFLNPGYLGSQKRFRNRWVKPMENPQNGDSGSDANNLDALLHKLVDPFILRRTKQQVADDLPPLTSTIVECGMDAEQQKVYETYRQVYRQKVSNAIETQGIRKSRFTVLEGLTRLRQICCSPEILEGENGNSSKLTRFLELAEELISEGHRALVFSQFVTFLKLIESTVQSRGWDYEYLDGKTRNRQERIDRFQSDGSKSLFLISLKAGGEGLNLTGADYVFLMDPWWNPAAERQAMDRTHRIGQSEHVFVYRFVCPGTVEEKMLRLQERKRDIADKLVTAEPGIFKQLERDDLIELFE